MMDFWWSTKVPRFGPQYVQLVLLSTSGPKKRNPCPFHSGRLTFMVVLSVVVYALHCVGPKPLRAPVAAVPGPDAVREPHRA